MPTQSEIKQTALGEAVDLAKVAFGSCAGSVAPFVRPENAVEFLDVVYHKLCELHADSLTD